MTKAINTLTKSQSVINRRSVLMHGGASLYSSAGHTSACSRSGTAMKARRLANWMLKAREYVTDLSIEATRANRPDV